MLTALSLRRISSRLCARDSASLPRYYASSRDGDKGSTPRDITKRGRQGRRTTAQEDVIKAAEEEEKASGLYEQLFGPSSEEQEARSGREEEVPRIPLETPVASRRAVIADALQDVYDVPTKSNYQKTIEAEIERDGPGVSVLVLRNASKNLAEEDFRRLIPQGSHLEGWTLEQGDILKVIPGRDPVTLERRNFYYLLFSSALGAFSYQGHATRVHKIVASHTPSSILSPIMPPPGIMFNDLDANAAIQSFSLVAPNGTLDLRQLRPPLTPLMRAIVRNRGYPFINARNDRMPFEARLTMEGPQLHESAIRHLFMLSGRRRDLSWSGNDRTMPVVTKWVPPEMGPRNGRLSGMSHKREAREWSERQEFHELKEAERDVAEALEPGMVGDGATQTSDKADIDFLESQGDKTWQEKEQRTYIVGFPTERAMQSFVHYWHRRPMLTEGFEHLDSDLPAIANVEALW